MSFYDYIELSMSKISRFIHQHGYYLQDLAQEMQLPLRTLQWRLQNPRLNDIQKIAMLLNCDLNDVVNALKSVNFEKDEIDL